MRKNVPAQKRKGKNQRKRNGENLFPILPFLSKSEDANTHYQVIASYGMLACHVSCELETGRTHQIRVHMTNLGHGLIGDQLYGRGTRRGIPEPVSGAVREFKRQALHAATLGFTHPTSNQDLRFEISPPEDFEVLKSALEKYARPR